MFKKGKAAGGVTIASLSRGLKQRAHPGKGADIAGFGEVRNHRRPFSDVEVNLLHGRTKIFQIVNAQRGGAENRDGATGHEDVAVTGASQAVDDMVGEALVTDQQGAFRIEKMDVGATGKAGDVHRPGATGVDHLPRADGQHSLPGKVAAQGALDSITSAGKRHHLGLGKVAAADQDPGVLDVIEGQAKGIDGGIWHPVGVNQFGREMGFQLSRLGRGQGLTGDAGLIAPFREVADELLVITLHRHEQAATFLDAMSRQLFEQDPFAAAFDRRMEIVGDVTGTGVKQAVVAARGSGAEVALVDKDGGDPAQGKIAHDPSSADPAANDQYLGFESGGTFLGWQWEGGCGHGGKPRVIGESKAERDGAEVPYCFVYFGWANFK